MLACDGPVVDANVGPGLWSGARCSGRSFSRSAFSAAWRCIGGRTWRRSWASSSPRWPSSPVGWRGPSSRGAAAGNRQIGVLLAATAAASALALLGFMAVTRTQDDSEVLADRIHEVALRLHGSGRAGEILAFEPSAKAGRYEIQVYPGAISVHYPQTPEGGPNWGQGRVDLPRFGGQLVVWVVPLRRRRATPQPFRLATSCRESGVARAF
jgi:hypothetical protein